MHGLVVVLALLAAFCMGLGIVIRQQATTNVPAEYGLTPSMLATLARAPLWWAGTGIAVCGYAFHALALAYGSLLLVQPLLVSSLLFALPLSAWLTHRRITVSEWVWALLLTMALAFFVVLTRTRPGHYRPPVPAWSLVAVVLVPLVVTCITVATRTMGRRRAVLLAAAVGIIFGTIAVLTKIAVHRLTVGGLSTMLSIPAPYLVVALAAAGTVLQQSAFHAGALQVSVPTMLVAEPVVAVLLAVIVLGESLRVTGTTALALTIAVVAIVAATIALGRDEGAHEEQLEAARPAR